jgi:hypothetical protein
MWQTVGTLGGVFVGALIGYWGQRALAAASDRRRWAERAAESIADTRMLLTDLHPDRVAFNFDPERTPAHLLELSDQARLVRRDIAVLGAGHPNAKVRTNATELEPAIERTWISVGWLARDMADHRGIEEPRAQAMESWNRSDELVKAITEELHD